MRSIWAGVGSFGCIWLPFSVTWTRFPRANRSLDSSNSSKAAFCRHPCPARDCRCALILAKDGHEGCRVLPIATLDEAIQFFRGERTLENALKHNIEFEHVIPKAVDFAMIRGQKHAKDAAYLAAAGGHNLLLYGPPGEGKPLLASALPGITPRLSDEEKVQLTRIYSAYGALERDGMAVTRRPMCPVHHTATKQALVGGGSKIPKPGEITLARKGRARPGRNSAD